MLKRPTLSNFKTGESILQNGENKEIKTAIKPKLYLAYIKSSEGCFDPFLDAPVLFWVGQNIVFYDVLMNNFKKNH